MDHSKHHFPEIVQSHFSIVSGQLKDGPRSRRQAALVYRRDVEANGGGLERLNVWYIRHMLAIQNHTRAIKQNDVHGMCQPTPVPVSAYVQYVRQLTHVSVDMRQLKNHTRLRQHDSYNKNMRCPQHGPCLVGRLHVRGEYYTMHTRSNLCTSRFARLRRFVDVKPL